MPKTRKRRGATGTTSHTVMPHNMGSMMPASMNAHQAEMMGSAKSLQPGQRGSRRRKKG